MCVGAVYFICDFTESVHMEPFQLSASMISLLVAGKLYIGACAFCAMRIFMLRDKPMLCFQRQELCASTRGKPVAGQCLIISA